jgi:predicted RNase H-like nuclease (RuvC/YqgF family)
MYKSDYSKNLITAEEKVAELMKQRDNLRAEVERLTEQCETNKRSISNAHTAIDESGILPPRDKTHQGLTPRVKSIIARAKKAEAELISLRAEVRQARKAWLGGDYDHLPLIEAMEKFRSDRETEFDAAEAECIALRSRAEKAEERLQWLETFLQAGGTNIFTSSSYTVLQDHPDDTYETRFNMPFKIGMSVETENRGCYKWVEFSNGAKGICPAIDAAKIKYDEWRREQF